MELLAKQLKAYNIIFQIENTIRVAMHNALIKKLGVDYLKDTYFKSFKYDLDGYLIDVNTTEIIENAMSRKKEEKNIFFIGSTEFPYLWYLDYSILIMFLDNFYEIYFSELFKKSKQYRKEIIKRGLAIIPIRNSIAHNRTLNKNEFSELEILSNIVDKLINESLLYNYSELVFNKIEELKLHFEKQTQIIINSLLNGEIISRKILREWESLFASIIPSFQNSSRIKLFNEITSYLVTYNKELPRKPGSMSRIKDFLEENSLLEKIKILCE